MRKLATLRAIGGSAWDRYMEAAGKAYQQADYDEAEKLLLAALQEAEKFGEEDRRLAASLNNLALLYRAQGRYAEAEPLYQRSLAMREQALGRSTPWWPPASTTWRGEKRPELDRLMADAHRRRFDAVVVWKFDRFARSVSHLLRALETFKALGIEFVSLSEQVDTSTPTGKMVFTVLGAVAELERSLIAERVRAGLRNARAKGKKLGRPRKAVDRARIASLRRTGASWAEISAQLGIGRGTAYRALQSLPKSLPKKVC